MADNARQAEVKTDYPYADGIVAGSTSQKGHQMNMLPSEGSIVSKRLKAGMVD